MGPAKPLSADEIVKANAKKRANGVQMGAPAKIGRLDAATMAALGKRGPASVLGQLPAQGAGPAAPGRGRPQLLQQAGAQVAGVLNMLSHCLVLFMAHAKKQSACRGCLGHLTPRAPP